MGNAILHRDLLGQRLVKRTKLYIVYEPDNCYIAGTFDSLESAKKAAKELHDGMGDTYAVALVVGQWRSPKPNTIWESGKG